MKKLLTLKTKASGASNLSFGSMVIFTICAILTLEAMLNTNIAAANFVEDNLTTSVLGCMLADPDEYGTSNTFVMYDLLENHAYSGKSYMDHVDGILLNKIDPLEMYYSTYLFDSVDEIDTIGSLTDTSTTGKYGPSQSFETFVKMLKVNMQLDNTMVPKSSAYLPKTIAKDSNEANKIKIESFKVYNCVEFMVRGTDFETDVRKPVLDTNSNTVYMCNDEGTPLYESYSQLKDAGVIHTKIVEFNIKADNNANIISTIATEYPVNEKVYVTDETGAKVTGKDGNTILIDASAVYTKISLHIKLGDKIAGDDIQYKKVAHERTAFIESSK